MFWRRKLRRKQTQIGFQIVAFKGKQNMLISDFECVDMNE